MNQKNVTIAALLVSLIALSVAVYSLNALTNRLAAKSPQVLTYDVKIVTFIVDKVSTTTDPTGNTFVVTGTIFPQGQVDKTAPVGNYTCFGTFSNKNGDDISVQILDITGAGEVILNGLEPGPVNVSYTGAIVGGTGHFADAQGTYAQFTPDGTILKYTLTITSTASS